MLCRLLFLSCSHYGNGMFVVVVFLCRLGTKAFCISLCFISFLAIYRYQSKFSIAINGFNNSVKWKWINFSSTSPFSIILLCSQFVIVYPSCWSLLKLFHLDVHGEITRRKVWYLFLLIIIKANAPFSNNKRTYIPLSHPF